MTIGEYCNREVVIVSKDTSVREATRLMREYHVGDLVVVDETGGARRPIGILTDRDIVIEILAPEVDIDAVTVGDSMSFKLVTATEDEELQDTLEMMRDKAVRRLPVVDKSGNLVGILSVDDIIGIIAELMVDMSRLITRQQAREQARRK